MSDGERPLVSFSPNPLHSLLSICIFVPSHQLAQSLQECLSSDRYSLMQLRSPTEFIDFVERRKEQIDCLVLSRERSVMPLLNQLYEQGILLPVVIVEPENLLSTHKSEPPTNQSIANQETAPHLYHTGEVWLPSMQLDKIALFIDQAIAEFLKLAPSCALFEQSTPPKPTASSNAPKFLMLQQRRLADKLKERLGYLCVYYKRNSQHFWRNLPQNEKEKLIEKLSSEYRQIILDYFAKDHKINQAIDHFVNQAFFADLPVSQILEIHMELMDEFAQQLKLEGRSEDILLDYRLTLIDIIAHIGEMYRRSIPREDMPFELLAQTE